MNRKALIRNLRKLAKDNDVEFTQLANRGRASHEMWSFNGRSVGIPRHNEINEHTANGILDDARQTLEEGQ